MYSLIDGKKTSKDIKNEIKEEVEKYRIAIDKVPGLAVILVGDDPASQVYVNSKEKTCKNLGIHSEKYLLPENTDEKELIALIEKLNSNDRINGILVQLPLPKQIDENLVLNKIDPNKDVDGFHPVNVGKLLIGEKNIPLPCTPAGIIEMLKRYEIEIEGKSAVILGRSNIVGKPMSLLLLRENATVTIAHSRTRDIKEITRKSDIIVSAVGKKDMVTADMVSEGAVIIDVGMNRVDGKLYGDVDFENVKEKSSYITPVPGGVGPMTIAMLMKNTLNLFKIKENL